jgi:hypothetical protein
VGPGASLDVLKKRKVISLAGISIPRRPVCLNPYTNFAIQAPKHGGYMQFLISLFVS